MPAAALKTLQSAYSHVPATTFLDRSLDLRTDSLGLTSHMKGEEKFLPTCVHCHVAKSTMAHRVFAKSPKRRVILKAVYIVSNGPWKTETATRSRGFGKPKKADFG